MPHDPTTTDSLEADFDAPTDDVVPESAINFDPAVLRHQVVVRGLVTTAAILLVGFIPNRSAAVIGLIAAIGLVLTGLLTLWEARKVKKHRLLDVVFGLALIALAVVFLMFRESSQASLGRLIAVTMVVVGVRSLVIAQLTGRGLALTGAGLQFAAAALLWFFPVPLLALVLTVAAIVNFGVTLIAIMQLSSMSPSERKSATTIELTTAWFRGRAQPLDDRAEMYSGVIFEGSTFGKNLARFLTLMTLASVIASMGVITDSTAVVIGAMLIAPLMTPLMGIATSLAMGWPQRLRRMALVALGGVVLAILVGLLLGAALSNFVNIDTNSQIQARVTPTLLDLLTAVAAGGAGAYGLSRRDVSDSLPGVAIAISLVPPLTVVGICYSAGAFASGTGALLLFLTNAVAIMIVGAFTLVLTGIAPLQQSSAGSNRVRDAAITILALAAIVLGGLLLNGREITTRTLQAGAVTQTVNKWLEDSDDFTLDKVVLDDPEVITILLTGPEDATPPDEKALASSIADQLGRPAKIQIQTTLIRVATAEADAP